MTSLREFYRQLDSFDWHYEFSDVYSIWLAGNRRLAELSKISRESPRHRTLFDAWERHMFSGPAWETEKAPKPEEPAGE